MNVIAKPYDLAIDIMNITPIRNDKHKSILGDSLVFNISLMQDDIAKDLTDCKIDMITTITLINEETVRIEHLYEDITDGKIEIITPLEGKIRIYPKSAFTKYEGTCYFEIVIRDINNKIYTPKVIWRVIKSLSNEVLEPTKDIIGTVTELKDILDKYHSGIGEGINPIAIINDLATGGITSALSAEQGKLLKTYADEQIESVNQRINTIQNNSGSLDLRDAVSGEIFKINTSTTPIITYGEIILSKTSIIITEGQSDIFTVLLDKAPTNNQIISMSSNNVDMVISPISITFTPQNWNIAQTITITTLEDSDYNDENGVISLSSTQITTKTINIAITDNDKQQTQITNLLYHSDTFESPSNVTTYYQAYKGTKEVIELGTCKYTCTDSLGGGIFKSSIQNYHTIASGIIENHKYYVKSKISIDGITYTINSIIVTAISTGLPSTTLFNYSNIPYGENRYAKSCILIDLTSIYGVGNEPAKDICDSTYGNTWNV